MTAPLKGRLDLEDHGGRSFERVAQRVLAPAAAIRHDNATNARSPGH
ncbi:hypothetical protein ACFSKW_43960 [Nonomuraea mangrovi]|uniref:Uncharacterized protein n=1 Tax=Nonomuraea mangrovi TaxID=2316207 RepID=A0ABW4TAL7_9ACTN